MAIYVDELRSYGQAAKAGGERYFGSGKQSCHMSCDGNLEELHQLAEQIGLSRSWFQHHRSLPHYDLTPNKRALVLKLGATSVSTGTAMKEWRASQGLCVV